MPRVFESFRAGIAELGGLAWGERWPDAARVNWDIVIVHGSAPIPHGGRHYNERWVMNVVEIRIYYDKRQ